MTTTDNAIILLIYAVQLLAMGGILYVEIVQRRFRHFATCVFNILFAILFLVVPIGVHIAFGGARSIVANTDYIHANISYYLIYSSCTMGIIVSQVAITIWFSDEKQVAPLAPFVGTVRSRIRLISYICLVALGWFVYVRATGLSLADLIEASRFSWFGSDKQSIVAGVVADYLIAAAPILVYYAIVYGKQRGSWTFLLVAVLVLLGYALCSKDRKWLIYSVSGAWGAYYSLKGKQIPIQLRAIIALILVAVPLVFWQVVRDTLFSYMLGIVPDFWAEAQDMAVRLLRSGDAPYYYHACIESIVQSVNNGVLIPFGVLRRQLFFFLPAMHSMGLKPEDIAATFSDVVHGGTELRRGNMPPGLYGSMVLSFKWYAAPFVLALVPIGLRKIDNLILRRNGIIHDVFVSATFSSSLLLLRGDDSGATYFIIANILMAIPIGFILSLAPAPRGRAKSERASSEARGAKPINFRRL